MVRKADQSEVAILVELAAELWDGHSLAELEHEFGELMENSDGACFIKYNESSLQFHLAAGFEVANRIICFKKKLTLL